MKFTPSISPATTDNITIYQGATFSKPFTWVTVDPITSEKTPVDLTGARIEMQLRTADSSSQLLVDFAEKGFINITQPLEGKWEISIPASETEGFDFRGGLFDMEVHFPDGNVTRVLSGKISVSREVTR